MQTVTITEIGEAAERILAAQEGTARLRGELVYPAPYLDAPVALSKLLTNPLLLACYPRRLAATAAAFAAGEYDHRKVVSVACWLLGQRDRLNNQTPGEPDDRQAERELLELLESPHLREQRAGLRRRVFLARPSEYEWLRGLVVAAIQAAAAGADKLLLAA